jgi:hypothetical protein
LRSKKFSGTISHNDTFLIVKIERKVVSKFLNS